MYKKILFIVTQSELGGAQKYVHSIATNLDSEKYKVIVAAGSGGWLLEKLAELDIETRKIKFLRRNINPLFDLFAFLNIYFLIKKERPRIIYLGSTKAGILGSIAAKSSEAKVIYRIGGWVFNEKISFIKKWIYVKAERITARFKDIIVVNSEFDKKSAISRKICPESKIKVICNGIDANGLKFFSKKKARDDLFKIAFDGKVSANKFLVGVIANFYPNKGLTYFIEAIRLLNNKNVVCMIMGDGIERKRLEYLILKYKLKNRVLFLGQVDEASKYLKAFDMFALPSIKEGMPWTILEAMAAGLPIVATRVGGVPEMIKDGEDGILVGARDSEELAGAIKKIISSGALRDKLSVNALNAVKTKFSFDKMFNETERLFSVEV